MNLKLKQEASQ